MAKTLSEIYGFKKSSKKIGARDLRRIILEEYRAVLREQEEAEESATITFTGQSNFKDFNDAAIDELFKQINSRDGNASIYKAMEFTPKDDEGNDLETVKPDPDKVADWLQEKGEDEVKQRIKAVGTKIPEKGLPKADMPFLPGPADAQGTVDQVVDALDGAGGDFSVDIEEPFAEVQEEAWMKGVQALLDEKKLPAKNTFVGLDAPGSEDFMTGGKKDEDETDDTIKVVPGGGMAASAATPTQTNILLPKALGMAVNGVEGGDLKAYASTDDEILDGHHRWAATMLNNPSADIGTIAKIDLNKFGTEDTLKILTLVGNALGNKTKTESRKNRDEVIAERWTKLAGILKG